MHTISLLTIVNPINWGSCKICFDVKLKKHLVHSNNNQNGTEIIPVGFHMFCPCPMDPTEPEIFIDTFIYVTSFKLRKSPF